MQKIFLLSVLAVWTVYGAKGERKLLRFFTDAPFGSTCPDSTHPEGIASHLTRQMLNAIIITVPSEAIALKSATVGEVESHCGNSQSDKETFICTSTVHNLAFDVPFPTYASSMKEAEVKEGIMVEKLTLTSTINIVANGTTRINRTLADVYKPMLRTAEVVKTDEALKNELKKGFERLQREMTCRM